jgi:hypothetical protein
MATEGVRSPTSHRTPAQIRKHGKTYQASKKRRAYRSDLNKERRRRGIYGKGGGDVAHTSPGPASAKNTRLQSASVNRGHGKSPGGTKAGTRARLKRGT